MVAWRVVLDKWFPRLVCARMIIIIIIIMIMIIIVIIVIIIMQTYLKTEEHIIVISAKLFLAVFAGSEGEYLFRRIG